MNENPRIQQHLIVILSILLVLFLFFLTAKIAYKKGQKNPLKEEKKIIIDNIERNKEETYLNIIKIKELSPDSTAKRLNEYFND